MDTILTTIVWGAGLVIAVAVWLWFSMVPSAPAGPNVRAATLQLFREYRERLDDVEPFSGPDKCDSAHIKWMCEEACANPEWPLDKLSRWLGFVQGILIMNGITTVEIERDRTRGMFQ